MEITIVTDVIANNPIKEKTFFNPKYFRNKGEE